MDIKDVVALVTGGASGLGEGTVIELAKRGARVAIVDVDPVKGEKLAVDLGANAIFVKGEDDLQQAIKKITGSFGKLNVAVNCAGIPTAGKIMSKKGPLPLTSFNKVVQVNLVGTLNVIRLAVEQMINNTANGDGEKGVIINTASIAAFEGQIGQAAYSASKGGIVSMTLPIARECAGYGIRVVTIAPGLFETPMMAGFSQEVKDSLIQTVPFPHRLGKALEYAKLACHIVDNAMFNGCCIRLDGALRMAPK
jgi:3-hydroxyacyl-CoA dehydrogenase/3-hydroxy-2-methylbutyryl-CoA dehydrogenase